MNRNKTNPKKYLLALLSLCIFLGVNNSAMAGPLTSQCNAKTSQGPEGVISRINCFRDEYLRLKELQDKIKSFLEYGRGIRGELSNEPQKVYQCRNHLGIMKNYKVPKKSSGGVCSDIKNQYSEAYNTLFGDYCRGFSSFNAEMQAQNTKVKQLSKAYNFCFDQSVADIIPKKFQKGDASNFTGHSAFNNRQGFITALNQLRDRWKNNNYEAEIKLLAKTCNDLQAYTKSKYPDVFRNFTLHCS